MENIAELPPLAVITFGAVVGLIFGVRYLGLLQGKKVDPAIAGGAQVAAVIVDPTALTAATAELSGLSVAVHELIAAIREASANQKRTAEELGDIREEMRIHREINRR